MPIQPKYRVKMSIYDEETAEEVCFSDDPMYSLGENEAHTQLSRLFTSFTTAKPEFENVHYPKDEDVNE